MRRVGDGRGDDGFTLVELMAALTVLAFAIVGTIGVMNSSIRVAGTTSARSLGVAVATRHVETLRAVPYDELVLTSPTERLVPIPERLGNRTYSVRRVISEETEATPRQPVSGTSPRARAYKKAHVHVSWFDQAGFHEVHQTTLIYPGGLGLHDVSGSVVVAGDGGIPDPPLSLTATSVSTATAVDLVWVPPIIRLDKPEPVSWVVQYSRDPLFPQTSLQEVAADLPATVTVLRVSDLAPGTTYHFRVMARSADGQLSSPATAAAVTTTASTATRCAVGAASVTPSAVKKRNASAGSGLQASPRVVVNTFGACSDTTFRMRFSTSAGRNSDVPLVGPDSSGTFAGTISDEGDWDVGDHPVEIFSYAGGLETNRASLRLTVCAHNTRSCP